MPETAERYCSPPFLAGTGAKQQQLCRQSAPIPHYYGFPNRGIVVRQREKPGLVRSGMNRESGPGSQSA